MAHIELDLLGDSEEETIVVKETATEPKPEAARDRRLLKQVININGEVVDTY